jgi:hypothetical protein
MIYMRRKYSVIVLIFIVATVTAVAALPASGVGEEPPPAWLVSEKELTGDDIFSIENASEIVMEASGMPKLKSNEATGETILLTGDPAMQIMKVTLHHMEVEGYPECKIKSEGAAEDTVALELYGEAAALANGKEEKTDEAGTFWFGEKAPITLEGDPYQSPLATVLGTSGTCPGSLPSQSVLYGDFVTGLGSINPTTDAYTQLDFGQNTTNPGIKSLSDLTTFIYMPNDWSKITIGGSIGYDKTHEPLDLFGTFKWELKLGLELKF